ncbi:hypothetical protein E4T52_11745 [Aureobasidium sp. EXF-3400]|nr:hypothetical protein E4T51_05119 [Aureobasidium sp. EXF-12344]KAI4773257.1 hypothetical protein E4T52_11745 [Aureobasidium sp. EXF-3400]
MRITVWILRPPEVPEGDIEKLALVVDQGDTFQQVWTLIQQRYRENYRLGRRKWVEGGIYHESETELTCAASDCYIKKIQDSTGADIDMRDTVHDILGEFAPSERIIHVQQLLHGRDDTVPFDSYLHPPKVAPTSQEQENINRRRIELDRYGTTLDNLDPDRPVESHEPSPEKRKDKDGFAIPALPPRTHVAHSSPVIPSSQLSQDIYENHLVRSPELGSPQKAFTAISRQGTPPRAANTASQYSTLDAVPSAQKPPTVFGSNRRSSFEGLAANETSSDLAGPISEDSQPRLSSSISQTPARSTRSNKRKSLDSSEVREINAQNLSNLWTEDEKDRLIDGLANGLSAAEMAPNFPKRNASSIRKKATAMTKDNPLAVERRKASLKAAWTEDEDAHFVRAIRKNQDWKTLRDHRFRDRSDDSVKYHYVQLRKQLEEKDAAKSARIRHQEQLKNGSPSTGPNEKFTQGEDDFLLACRVENVDMKPVAKEFFPLRPLEQVTNRAGSLYHNVKRVAAKGNPLSLGRSPSVEFLFEHDPETAERLEPQRQKAREFKKKSSNTRAQETEGISRRRSLLNSGRERTEERREKEDKQRKVLDASEEAKRQDESVKRRRLNEDMKLKDDYNQQFSAWKKEAAAAEQAGRPIPPRPDRPIGSSIGTEVLTTTPIPHPASSTQKSIAEGSKSRTSVTPLAGQGTKKRRTSHVEVQVVIPSSKKQKTAATAKATPQVKQLSSKAASASKVPALSTPNRSAPQVVAQSAMAKLGRTTQPEGAGANPSHARERPSVTFASISATQPVGSSVFMNSAKDNAIRDPSSPGVATAKSLRQSKIAFLRDGQQLSTSSARKSTPASARKSSAASVTPRTRTAVDDSISISSDEESSYDDNDITDEELNAVAERSEAMYSSSPVKSPLKKNPEVSVQHKQPNLASRGADALRSSPPVASMPTPKSKVLRGMAALKSAVKTGSPLSSTMPSFSVSEISPSMNRKTHKKLDTPTGQNILTAMQGVELPEFEMSTAEHVASDHEEDVFMIDEDQIQHATHSTPVFPNSSPEAGAQDGTITAIPDQDVDDDISPTSDISVQSATEETGPESTSTAPAGNKHSDVSNNKEEDPPHLDPDTDDAEEIECYRSDSRDVQQVEDWPSERSEGGMPFPKPPVESFGPFVISNTERVPNLNAAAKHEGQSQATTENASTTPKEQTIGEQAMHILTSSPAKAEKLASTAPAAEKLPSLSPSQSKSLLNGPSTCPAAHPSEDSPAHASGRKKARRIKGSRILSDAHSFKPPPSSPLPDLLKGGGLRKPAKQPAEDRHRTLATESNGTSFLEDDSTKDPPSTARAEPTDKQSTQRSKGKRPSLSLEESVKNMVEKGQALGTLSQAPASSKKRKVDQPASTQPVKKVALVSSNNKVASSQPVSNNNAGRVINPHAFDWDNAQDSAELIRQADQRMRDAANMAPEDFWQQSNLNNMNEEQVLSHMIAQGVKRSMARRERERGDSTAIERIDDFAANMSATQPVQRSLNATNGLTPRPATQPVKQVSHLDSDSSSSEDDDSGEETLEQSLEALARQAEASSKERRANALPYW